MDRPVIKQEDISIKWVKEDSEYNQTKIKIKQLRDLLHQWKEDTEKAVKELENLANDLDKHFRNISIAKVTGSSTAIVGGILTVVGFGLSFVTFGASLGLSIAGGILAGAGGTTTGGSMIANAVISKNRRQATEVILQKCKAQAEKLKSTCGEISTDLQKYGNMDDCFSDWVNFWAKLVLGVAGCTKNVGWDMVARNIITGIQFVSYADDAARVGAQTAATVFRSLGTAGRALHVIGGVVGILFMPLDIYTLVDSAVDVHKQNPAKVSEDIRNVAKRLSAECPKKEFIDEMIEKTLKSIETRRYQMYRVV